MSFFFANFVHPPREFHTNLLIESVFPIYSSVSPESPLRPATLAVASVCFDFYRTLKPHAPFARKHWANAIAATRNAILDPSLARSDEVLAAIFMLDFYEGLVRRYIKLHDNAELHHRAAMAVVQARGLPAESEYSKRLFSYLRSKHVAGHLQARKRIQYRESDDQRWTIARLNPVIAELTNVLADLSEGKPDLQAATDVLRELEIWRRDVPASWEPHRLSEDEVPQSIWAVGMYNGLCDVYCSHTVAQMMNFWRTIMITALRVMDLLSGPRVEQIQGYVDDICASVPFNLGNRMTYYTDAKLRFPPVPAWLRARTTYIDAMGNPTIPAEADHMRNAISKGAWFITTPLTTLLEFALPCSLGDHFVMGGIDMRPGQLDWIAAQCWRVHQIMFMPWPYGKERLEGVGGSLSVSPSWGVRSQQETADNGS